MRQPNAPSLSRMRYLGAVCQGNASVIWRAHRKSKQPSALMAKDETYEEAPKGNPWNDKQVNGSYIFPMIAKERFPALQRPALPRHHVDRNRGLRDIDVQFEQFAVDPGSAPQ